MRLRVCWLQLDLSCTISKLLVFLFYISGHFLLLALLWLFHSYVPVCTSEQWTQYEDSTVGAHLRALQGVIFDLNRCQTACEADNSCIYIEFDDLYFQCWHVRNLLNISLEQETGVDHYRLQTECSNLLQGTATNREDLGE